MNAYAKYGGKTVPIDTQVGSLFGTVRLLGVYQGAWDSHPGEILAADRNLKGDVRVPVGMGVVIPIGRVVETIKGDERLKNFREEAKQHACTERAAKMDDAFSSSPSTEEGPVSNPNDREDFTSLLNAAAKKKKQGDQT